MSTDGYIEGQPAPKFSDESIEKGKAPPQALWDWRICPVEIEKLTYFLAEGGELTWETGKRANENGLPRVLTDGAVT